MRHRLPALLGVLIALLGAAFLPLRVRVAAPRLGRPVVQAAGTQAQVRLKPTLPFLLPPVHLRLEGPGGSAPLQVAAAAWEGGERVLTVTLPDLPEGAYALKVEGGGTRLLLEKAVWIRNRWAADLHLVQIADLPPPGQEPLMRRFVDLMNQRRPDAVLVSGDIAYTGSEAIYRFIDAELHRLDMPVILTPGNHEREGWWRFIRTWDVYDHRVDLGPLAILSLDSAHGRDGLTPGTFRWLKGELGSLGGRTPVLQLHHPLFPPDRGAQGEAGKSGGFLRGHRQALLDLCAQHQVPLVLGGHWHQDAVFDATGRLRSDRPDFEGTKYVVTTALGAELRHVIDSPTFRYGYRWITFRSGRLVTYGVDPINPIPSTPLLDPAP